MRIVRDIFTFTLLATFFAIVSIVLLEIVEIVLRVNIPDLAAIVLGASLSMVTWVVVINKRSKDKQSN